jgi:hypothetical protein
MPNFDRTLVDPSVTDEEIERALDADPAGDYPDVDEQDHLDDEQLARGLLSPVPATPREAIEHARTLREQHTFVGVGMCLATVRGPIYRVPALWPDAETAMAHSAPFHAVTDPASTGVPRASVGFASNGRHGHVWLELGAVGVTGSLHALVSTTDFHEPGFEGVALRSKMLTWCGAQRFGWGETVDGIDVWPTVTKKPAPPKPWSLQDRRDYVHRRLVKARDDGHGGLAHQLKLWQDKMDARLQVAK